jgi:hypothetical protein
MKNPDAMNQVKLAVDAAAACVTCASLMNWLPPIAAGLSILWLLVQLGDWVYRRLIRKDWK